MSEAAAGVASSWWYEWEGRQAGPVDEDALRELVRGGKLGGEARVWRAGMAGWEPVRAVPELAPELPPVAVAPERGPTPPAGAEGRTPPPFPRPPGAGWRSWPQGMDPVSPVVLLGLGVVTLGIYPAFKFFQAGMAYEALAGRASRFGTYFWIAVALTVFGVPLHALGIPGFLTHVAAIACAVLTLIEFLNLRAEVVARHGVAPVLTSAGTHQALFISGILTCWFLVGFALLAFQLVKLFQDHEALAEALQARGAAA